jgi:hypothetical protein
VATGGDDEVVGATDAVVGVAGAGVVVVGVTADAGTVVV